MPTFGMSKLSATKPWQRLSKNTQRTKAGNAFTRNARWGASVRARRRRPRPLHRGAILPGSVLPALDKTWVRSQVPVPQQPTSPVVHRHRGVVNVQQFHPSGTPSRPCRLSRPGPGVPCSTCEAQLSNATCGADYLCQHVHPHALGANQRPRVVWQQNHPRHRARFHSHLHLGDDRQGNLNTHRTPRRYASWPLSGSCPEARPCR